MILLKYKHLSKKHKLYITSVGSKEERLTVLFMRLGQC